MGIIIMKEQKEKTVKTENSKQYNIKAENIKKMNIYLNKTKNGK